MTDDFDDDDCEGRTHYSVLFLIINLLFESYYTFGLDAKPLTSDNAFDIHCVRSTHSGSLTRSTSTRAN